jgi:hypothetical protein
MTEEKVKFIERIENIIAQVFSRSKKLDLEQSNK